MSRWTILRRQAGEEQGAGPGRGVDEGTPAERRLCCAGCRHVVTTEAARVEIAGAHRHTCVNPAGFVFRIGCFARAPGVEGMGERVAEDSWFPGYTWQLALCARCSTHLGWRFRGLEPAFEGLILDRLVEDDG